MYRYLGIYLVGMESDIPGGVIRVWTDAAGRQHEETFSPSLTWEPSDLLSRWARPTDDKYMEIDEPMLERFIAKVRSM